jgi:hypothetical protein
MRFKAKTLALGTLMAALAAGCGGGGGGTAGAVAGLAVPDNMSVISAKTTGGSAKPAAFKTDFGGLAKAFTDADTEYSTDPSHTWVYDPSIAPLDTVNMILCLMDQMKADTMVNQGTYLALVDFNKCQQGSNDQSGSSGQSTSAGKSTVYWNFIVNSTRASDSAPEIVKVWISGQEPNGPGGATKPMRVNVKVTVNDGVSTTKPFGDFVMNYSFPDPSTGVSNGGGTLKTVTAPTGEVAYTIFETQGTRKTPLASYAVGERYDYTAGTVEMTPDGTTGKAQTATIDEGNDGGGPHSDEGAFGIAFDAGYMRRGEAANTTDLGNGIFTSDVCLSRDTFHTNIWRYDLYHAADGTFNGAAVTGGERVRLNSGFPFTYDNAGTTVFGHIGYWGMWVEDPTVTIANGATINKMDFATGATTPYTVLKAPGKLIRRTARSLALSKLAGETLSYWGPVDDGGGPRFSQWQVQYSGTAFNVVAEVTGFDQNGPVTSPVSPAVDVTPASGQFLGLWSDSLGGDVNFVGGDANVTFYEEAFVSPDDPVFSGGALTLACMQQCVKGAVSQSDLAGAWDAIYQPNAAWDLSSGVTSYTIDPTDMTLKLGTDAVTFAAGVDPTGTNSEWGMRTGDMVTPAVLGTMTTTADLWNPAVVSVTYRWETGQNDYNQFVAVKDGSGNFASFDRPLQFAYDHATANDRNGDATYDGKTYRLNYGGNGDLWGIPSAVDGGTGRWYPLFAIKDGTPMGPTGTEFVIKAREGEQSMAVVAGSNCASVDFTPPAEPLPTAVDGVPNIGAMPTVTDAPAVIGGELQTSS